MKLEMYYVREGHKRYMQGVHLLKPCCIWAKKTLEKIITEYPEIAYGMKFCGGCGSSVTITRRDLKI